ncbi:hypothetical protein FQN54_006236 [Arachnomyces sp. PD_36]|nr:hypothetical protein FQN54_006236 [Arachnomyces sp. PD_36]
MFPRISHCAIVLLALSSWSNAHGDHSSSQDDGGEKDWATEHMREEHHIDNFDPASFFILHDYDSSGVWTPDEVRTTYGLNDESNAGVSEERKQEVVREVFRLFDPNNKGHITKSDWMRLNQAGRKLPDFGHGPGHHGDLEYEYEIHHFEKFHGEDTTEEDLIHPEDIEHFARHDREEDERERLEQLEKMTIVLGNIPQKFLRRP